MDIYITDGENLVKYSLPQRNAETFSINYKSSLTNNECFINLLCKNGKWQLESNGICQITQNGQPLLSITLQDYGYYVVLNTENRQTVYLFAIPTSKEKFYKLNYGVMTQFTIGNSNTAAINYKNNLLTGDVAAIIKENDNWKIQIIASGQFPIFKNRELIKESSILTIGDVLFICGLKIIWMGEFIEINNPNNAVTITQLTAYIVNSQRQAQTPITTTSEQNYILYKDSDYFYHTPRIREMLEENEIKIDPPPGTFLNEETPWIISVGSSLTMVAASFVMLYNIITGFVRGKQVLELLPQIVMCTAMLVGSLIVPRIGKAYQKRRTKRKEKKRIEKYTQYIENKDKEIASLISHQMQVLQDNFPSLKDCLAIILNQTKDFWSRTVTDDDFLTVRLGLGIKDAMVKIDVPEKHFSIEEDALVDKVYALQKKYEKIENVPITMNLAEQKFIAYICRNTEKEQHINSIILQLVALHSPKDLKIIVFTDKENENKWGYIKYFPHCFNDTRTVRYFSTNIEEAKDISNDLTEILKARKESISQNVEGDIDQRLEYKNFETYYLILTDTYKNGNSISIISDILNQKNNLGFSLFIVSDSMKNLPPNCQTFVEIGSKDGAIISKNITSNSQITFQHEPYVLFDPYEYGCKLARIPMVNKEDISLPTMISFMEMYGVSKIEQLNIGVNWETNNPVLSLAAPIGVHEDGELFKLNLHEKNHGPHGLIAGSTGSGKSEFIITYILSMAVSYHPYEVQFVLIDYKGGGLAGAFENKETGVRLPHLAGTITNLDVSSMNRTLVSIQSELKRRQRVFNEAKDSLGESTIDIYKYQRLYREGAVKMPMSHLFIISDEFAELKSQQPEFMDQLISIARIGRSLGVHLILATQKPSGVVNDQIWSNSKFKVCLKVQSRADSMEMLKRPEAASIKETGRFYLQVGYDDLFVIGQSAWAGAKYIPSDKPIQKTDETVDFIGNTGNKLKSIKSATKVDNSNDYGDQLTNIVKYLYALGKKENIVSQKLWLDPLEETIYLSNIKQKYQYKPSPYLITPVIGEYDNPKEQTQGIVCLDLSNNGNTLIFGQTGSGKENLLTTILWSTITEHTPDEVHLYVMDFGSETLKVFKKMPHVGEVISLSEIEKIEGLFDMLNNQIEIRRGLFSDYGGSYMDYCKNSGSQLPLIVTIINGYEMFCETYSKLSEEFQNLYRDGSKYGLVFIISALASNSVRSRMVQNFNNLICLQLSNQNDYNNILNSPRSLMPASFYGRGLIRLEDNVFEFQTGLFVPREQITKTVREAAITLSSAYHSKAPNIPIVPEVVTLSHLSSNIMLSKLPIGFQIDTKKEYFFDFTANFTSIITASMDNEKMKFLYALLTLFTKINEAEVTVIDCVEGYEEEISNVRVINHDFDRNIAEINNACIQNPNQECIYMVLGIGQLKNQLSESGNMILNEFFQNINHYSQAHFIFVDTNSSYRNLQFEEWYGKIDRTNGIWLGQGISNQVTLQVTDLDLEKRNLNFPYMGFVIENGKGICMKYVIKEGEDSEQ